MCRYSLQFLGGYLFHVCHLPFSLLALRSIFLRISRIDGQSQKIVFLVTFSQFTRREKQNNISFL